VLLQNARPRALPTQTLATNAAKGLCSPAILKLYTVKEGQKREKEGRRKGRKEQGRKEASPLEILLNLQKTLNKQTNKIKTRREA